MAISDDVPDEQVGKPVLVSHDGLILRSSGQCIYRADAADKVHWKIDDAENMAFLPIELQPRAGAYPFLRGRADV